MTNSLHIKSRIGSFQKMNDYVGELTFNGTHDATIEEIREFVLEMNAIMDHKPFYLINLFNDNLGSFSLDIWNYLGADKDANAYLEGSVSVIKSLGYKLQLNRFLKKYNPNYPINSVDTKEEAYVWIETLRSFISE